jgi:hypothetical protein
MAFMFARVELHNAADGDYEDLHSYMSDAKFYRRMKSAGQSCDLPWAYYASVQYDESSDALTAVQKAVRQTGKKSSIVVSKATEIVYAGLLNCKEAN